VLNNSNLHQINQTDTEVLIDRNDEEFGDYGLWVGSKNSDIVFGFNLLVKQFYTLILKRFIHSMRNKTLVVVQLLIPIGVLIINMVYLKYAPIKPGDSPALKIDIENYRKNFVPLNLHYGPNVPANDSVIKTLSELYALQFNKTKNSVAFDLNSNDTVTLCQSSRGSIQDFISCLGSLSLNYIVDDYIVATDFNEFEKQNVSFVGYFNNQPYHVPPMALNFISNTLLKYYTNSTSNNIFVINHPLPRDLNEQLSDLTLKDMTGFNVATGLTFGFAFLISSFIIFLIKEKSSDAKHLQYMSGCNSYIFWISAFLWDMVNYLIPVVFVVILLKV
jgi:ATP-binding cassette subfamily A (ABC1) protein 3